MSAGQNLTTDKTTQGDKVVSVKHEAEFDKYLTFCAIGGIVTSDDGELSRISLDEFASSIGVSRTTLWTWKKCTPDFGMLVRKRRDEVFPLARETRIFNRLYTIALTSKDAKAAVDASKVLLGHGGNLKLPVQHQQVEAGENLMQLLNIARKKQVLEGEVSDT